MGLTAFNLRQYDAHLGRWQTPDPYGQHHSPYLAMSNNPVSFTDPDGGYDEEAAMAAMNDGGWTYWTLWLLLGGNQNMDDWMHNQYGAIPAEEVVGQFLLSDVEISAIRNKDDWYATTAGQEIQLVLNNLDHISPGSWNTRNFTRYSNMADMYSLGSWMNKGMNYLRNQVHDPALDALLGETGYWREAAGGALDALYGMVHLPTSAEMVSGSIERAGSLINALNNKNPIGMLRALDPNTDMLLGMAQEGVAALDGDARAQGSLAVTAAAMLLTRKVGKTPSTKLYRAVGPNELKDLNKDIRYRTKPGGAEGKYFFPTAEQASNFARMKADKPYTTTSVNVSASQLNRATQIHPAGEGPAYYFNRADLPNGPVTIFNHSVLP